MGLPLSMVVLGDHSTRWAIRSLTAVSPVHVARVRVMFESFQVLISSLVSPHSPGFHPPLDLISYALADHDVQMPSHSFNMIL